MVIPHVIIVHGRVNESTNNECRRVNPSLLPHLRSHPVDYRQALALLDPAYHEWRPEGPPPHKLDYAADVPLLSDERAGICYVLGKLTDISAPRVAAYVSDHPLNELYVFGQASFRLLKALVPAGQWRLSRNYQATPAHFLPQPCADVRKLLPSDRDLLETGCKRSPALAESQSTRRDFGFMARGLPVTCYGAILEGQLAGFCSANPICPGVTEISWLVVAEDYRRRGIASSLLTAQVRDIFARGEVAAYYAGEATDYLDSMLGQLGFREVLGSYRFIPAAAIDQWRASWGKPVF